MKILVTGVGGMLGAMVSREAAKQGHEVTGVDFIKTSIEGVNCIVEDTTDLDTCLSLAQGVDIIAHMGAYHGKHLERISPNDFKTEKEFFDANVGGTFNLLQAGAKNNIKKFVLASSVVVYEKYNWQIFGIYSLSKTLAEDVCQFMNKEHNLSIIGLRFGTFVPSDLPTLGFGMLGSPFLGNWIHADEVTRSVMAAMENTTVDYGMYDVQTPLNFMTRMEEWQGLINGSVCDAIKEKFPEHASLIEDYKHLIPTRINTIDMTRTQRDLNFTVEKDFPWFLNELARRKSAGESLENI